MATVGFLLICMQYWFTPHRLPEPVFTSIIQDGDQFTTSSTQLQLVNNGLTPVRLRGEIKSDVNLRIQPSKVEVIVPGKTTSATQITIASDKPLKSIDGINLFMEYTTNYTIPDFSLIKNTLICKPIAMIQPSVCKRCVRPITIDGVLNEWESLPFSIPEMSDSIDASGTNARSCVAHFNVCCDDTFLYIAVNVTGDKMIADPTKRSRNGTTIKVDLDARPDPDRSLGRGTWRKSDPNILTMFLNPRLPSPGFPSACITTPLGFDAETAIPIGYLNDRQREWQAFRINIAVYDADTPDDSPKEYSWRPAWHSRSNYAGSGTFLRK